jgi:hypothetical protein
MRPMSSSSSSPAPARIVVVDRSYAALPPAVNVARAAAHPPQQLLVFANDGSKSSSSGYAVGSAICGANECPVTYHSSGGDHLHSSSMHDAPATTTRGMMCTTLTLAHRGHIRSRPVVETPIWRRENINTSYNTGKRKIENSSGTRESISSWTPTYSKFDRHL